MREQLVITYLDKDGSGVSTSASLRPLAGGQDMAAQAESGVIKDISPVTALKDIFQGPEWLSRLSGASNEKIAELYPQESMVPVTEGMGYCIDDRIVGYLLTKGAAEAIVVDDSNKKEILTPGFVGGFGGWVVMYMMRGMALEEALEATNKLYDRMDWKTKQAHIDNDHGDQHDVREIAKLRSGCGFLGKAALILEQAREVLGVGLAPSALYDANNDGARIVQYVLDNDGTVVVVTGHHDPQAHVIVNNRAGKTLDRSALYGERSVYLWDMHASANETVLAAFNEFDHSTNKLGLNDFQKMQAFMHVATGFALKAMDPAAPGDNFALLN